MLVTKQKIFRNFWYPVAPISTLQEKPLSFKLLNQNIVVWLDQNMNLSALDDRCCHRSAKLSLGKIVGDCLQCPYHGWCYNHSGAVVHIPQLPRNRNFPNHKVKSYAIRECYGYAWVCLGTPVYDIPEIVEANDANFRLIHEFYEPWQCAGLRVMENELDLAHPSFVHTQTFGNENHLVPSESKIEEFENGLHLFAKLGVTNPEQQQKNLKMQEETTVRHLTMTWFMPFTCKLDILYPNGLRHIIVNTMTPITDQTSQRSNSVYVTILKLMFLLLMSLLLIDK